MKRPLFTLCLAVALMIAAYVMIFPPPLPETGLEGGEEIFISGRIFKKEYRISYGRRQLLLYLSDLSQIYPQNNTSQQEIQLNKVICYLNVEGTGTQFFEYPEQEGKPPAEPEMGSTVHVQGIAAPFSRASNPGGFDAGQYYASLGIDCAMKECTVLWKSRRHDPLREWLWSIRRYGCGKLERALGSRDASVLANILFGDKETLDKDIRSLYQKSGIAHILAVSGLHISILGMGLYRLLRRCGAPIFIGAAAGTILILLYWMMTGEGISACRAAGMFCIHMLAEILGRTYDMPTAAGVLLVLMLAGQPRYLFHSGFLLSFASILGIGCLHPALFGNTEEKAGRRRYRQGIRKKCHAVFTGLGQSAGMGVSILLATMPVQLWFYYELPVYGTVLNLLVLPLTPVLLLLGILVTVLPPGILSNTTAAGIHAVLYSYEKLCGWSGSLPGHTWTPGRPAFWQVLLYLAILAAVALTAGKHSSPVRCGWGRGLCLAAGTGILALRLHMGLSVTVLDVGQGECICIRMDGRTYLVDGGSTDRQRVGEYDILPFLKYWGITRIESIFITHTDKDHYNGILELLETDLAVGRLVLPPAVETAEGKDVNRDEILKTALERDISVQTLAKGKTWREAGADYLCLHPEPGFAGESSNAGSLSLYLSYEGFSMLLTGDVEGEGEKQLTDALRRSGIHTLTVLKVAHHGSRYSTTADFLQGLDCRAAVISCGPNNIYGHPHPEVVERLEQSGADIYTTPGSGAVSIRVINGKAWISPFSGP